jgi:ABC-type antimicrobial peptide transport system permease subunit
LGIALGSVISTSLTQFPEWPTDISGSTALGSFAFAAFIGILWLVSARRAAEIDPMDALRVE